MNVGDVIYVRIKKKLHEGRDEYGNFINYHMVAMGGKIIKVMYVHHAKHSYEYHEIGGWSWKKEWVIPIDLVYDNEEAL